ncbi:MAG: electron transport complex subunit RsxC, partial [Kangiellaceae bacterium]|jgi:electron transport complex protein RnfC|nr:electron transport complex subunit RsxC [Kangiellaceae bacterium]
VLKGQLIAAAEGNISANIHASISGKVTAIEARPITHPGAVSATCIEIQFEPSLLNQQEFMTPIEKPFKQSRELLIERVFAAGVVGMGGALFPSHIKLKQPVATLIINAAECEPYITCDDRLMQDEAKQLIQAFELMQYIVTADRCIIGIEDNKPEAVNALSQAIIKLDSDITICVVPTKYPSGGQEQLIELITGQQVPQNNHAYDIGILMFNVATALAAYRAIVLGEPLIERVVTLTGQATDHSNTALLGNYYVAIGTPFEYLLNQIEASAAAKVIMGGPMMGFEVHHRQAPVIKSTNCIIAAATDELANTSDAQPCIRCGDCAEVCPASLLPQQLYWFARSDNFDKAQEYNVADCIECGACNYVCPSDLPLVDYYRYAKSEIKRKQIEKQKADIARQRHEFKEMRIARDKKERAEKHKKAAEARRQKAQKKGISDEKQATVAEAVARAKARKQAKTLANKNAENNDE